MAKTGIIYGINGPIVHIGGDVGFEMHEMVYVGKDNLVGEVIGLASDDTIIQVYEETTGMKPGETVTGTGAPVSVTLAPGILNNIFDGIERPLSEIAKDSCALHQPWCQRGFPGYKEIVGYPHYCQKRRPCIPRLYHCRSSGNSCHHAQSHASSGYGGFCYGRCR